MMKAIEADVACVWPARALLGEGPCWDARTGELVWVDIKQKHLHAYDGPRGRQRTWSLPCRLGSVAVPPPHWSPPADLAASRLFLGCGDVGLAWIAANDDHLVLRPISHPEPELLGNRFNDGKIGPDGRYWAGTMDDAEQAASGSLYAFAADGSHERLDDGYRVSNGPAFGPCGRIVYHTDSVLRVVYVFDLMPSGRLAGKRVFTRFSEHEGHPDGMTTDRHGNLWIALWDGGRIAKLSPEGKRLGCIQLPTPRPTSCVVADADCRDMFVTSARVGIPRDDQLAGGLFRIRL
jgi:sugar lactone lactonase YvrE